MDLYASMLYDKPIVRDYIEKNYGPIPRIRGARIMRYESPEVCKGDDDQCKMWARYCGRDVIYIHTRCGGSNYEDCGGKEWEERNEATFLDGTDDEFDCTYRDSYFTAVIDDDYNEICKQFEEGVLI